MSTAETYVGRSELRTEDLRFISGTGEYGADVNRDGQLYARVVRSDVPFGRLTGVDADAALARPGVVRVISSADLPDVRIPVRLFPEAEAQEVLQPPLASGTVRYVGEPVAVVVAEDPYVAEDAAEEILFEIEPLDPVLDTADAVADGAPVLHPDLGKNIVDQEEARFGEDVDQLASGADVVIRKRISVQRHGAVPMEPRVLVAEYDEDAGVISLWGAAKVKHFNRRCLAGLLGKEVEDVRLIECDVGGGFGARGEFYPEDFLIPWLAIELGRPVKWVEDRRENLIALNHSREQDWDIEVSASSDGTLLGYSVSGWFNQGGYCRTHGSVLLPRLVVNHFHGPYRWQGFVAQSGSVLTNKTPAGTYRGPGQYEGTFLRERTLDILAAELDMDPVELRRKNLISPDELPYLTGLPAIEDRSPFSYVEGDYPATFEAALERGDYESVRAEAARHREAGEHVGVGVAAFIEMGSPGPFEQSRIAIERDGSFTVHVGIASVGQGVQTVLAQVVADVLGVPIEKITISHHDTAVIPEGLGAFSSRATMFGGNAVAGASRELLAAAREAVAERLGVAADAVETSDGRVSAKSDGDSQEIALSDLHGLEAEYRYAPEAGGHIVVGANLAVAELDARTGEAKLTKMVVSYEIGKAINPMTLEGQIAGGAAQGIAGVMFEEFSYSEDGQPLSTSFMDYAMPTAAEIPDVDIVLLEFDQDDDDPMAGARGGGEGGIVGTGSAVANAIADALGAAGREITELPITPERIQALAMEVKQ
ncbi:MAG: xanthine dehydrogenase family protein molybdopterin-binding subunit [Solirubrobacterales bacterium]